MVLSPMPNFNVEYFIIKFKEYLDSIQETITEDRKMEVCQYYWIIPQNAKPTHYSSFSYSFNYDSDYITREVVPMKNVNVSPEHENTPILEEMSCHWVVISTMKIKTRY